MRVLRYNDLSVGGFEDKIEKIAAFLGQGDFRKADAKKLNKTTFYRAKLDYTNRLLFSIAEYKDEKVILLLELIKNHRYERSRFLNGRLLDLEKVEEIEIDKLDSSEKLNYLEERQKYFYLLNKPLVFDPEQQNLYNWPLPAVIIGSAGSGKTSLTLEKMKLAHGRVLYVTLSQYLSEHARSLYYSQRYQNEKQEVDFFSYQEFIETLNQPPGKELEFNDFQTWINKQNNLPVEMKNSHKVFEEIKGVITGACVDKAYLSEEEYLGLGVKQSIFLEKDRPALYKIFRRYLEFLKGDEFYDLNLISYEHLAIVEGVYDYVFIDEVQDLTNIQIFLLLKALKKSHSNHFILSGDSNQIVHPNFFSWSQVKTLFFKTKIQNQQVFKVLQRNYRCSQKVSDLANRILLLKNSRFGSIDKESNYLISAKTEVEGEVNLISDRKNQLTELNSKTSESTKFAVIVLHDSDKDEARRYFKTPLLFSIREVKGLEYENIILYKFVSKERNAFSKISSGVTVQDLETSDLKYSRNKDKSDKDLETYKFFINALYVAVSRCSARLIIIENSLDHEVFRILSLKQNKHNVEKQSSSKEEWQQEAMRLEKQGKEEQAQAILRDVLKIKPVPWQPLDERDLDSVVQRALSYGAKQQQRLLLGYTGFYHDDSLMKSLSQMGYPSNQKQRDEFIIKRFCPEILSYKELNDKIREFGIEFRNRLGLTPLMTATKIGDVELVEELLDRGAKKESLDFCFRSPMEIALQEGLSNHEYRRQLLPRLYSLLMLNSIKVRYEGRMIKLNPQQIEYFLVLILKAKIAALMKYSKHRICFTAAGLEYVLQPLPNSVFPERRKKRSYISAVLAKNEVKSTQSSRRLLVRIQRGQYILNPSCEFLMGDTWISACDFLGIDRLVLTNSHDDYAEDSFLDLKDYHNYMTGKTKEMPAYEF